MNLPLIPFLCKIIFAVAVSLVFVQCQDDPAREAAQKAALESAEKPAPAEPVPPAKQPVRPPTSGAVTLQATGGTVVPGEEICVTVNAAQDFKQIMSMQYSMKWNPEVLEFVTVKNFGLPGLSGNNFGGVEAKQGILRFSWFDQNVQGITRAGGHTLYDVCFRARGKAGEQTQFQFTDTPVIIEITNSANLFLDLNGPPAKITINE